MFKSRSSPLQNRLRNLPAPVGGLDAISSIMSMKENRAVVLENWLPKPDGLYTRQGYVTHSTGYASEVKALHTYAASTGAETLWATNAQGVYDATLSGAGSLAIALTNGETISTSIATGAGNFMFLVNGVDTLKRYDGTSWTSIATLGPVSTFEYSYVETYRQRLFFIKRNSLEVEYLPPNSISGTPTNYPLGAVFRGGGELVAMATWTIDAGIGPEDNLVFITSKGEIAVYVGNDPAIWTLKGVYTLGRPLGAKCLCKYGGDLLVLTETGVTPLSATVQSTSIDRTRPFTQTIRSVFNAAAAQYSASYGWSIIVDPITPMVVVNIPSTPVKKQAVMHSQLGAWTLFSGWNASCFGRVGNELYFGDSNSVCRITGFNDNGANVVATMFQAYSRWEFNSNKMARLVKPYLSSSGPFDFNLGIASNFSDPRETTLQHHGLGIAAGIWGTSLWGTGVFTGSTEVEQSWITVPDDYSMWKALYLSVTTRQGQVGYFGSDIIYVPGGNF